MSSKGRIEESGERRKEMEEAGVKEDAGRRNDENTKTTVW